MSIPAASLVLSFDVISLYTNIPHDELRVTLQEIFDFREHLHPPTHFLLDLVNFLMENNYFRYDHKYYLQIKGVVMGSAFAPHEANLFMDRFEQQHILNPQVNPFYEHLAHYHCYIDDIFCIYNDPPSYLTFQSWHNQLHPTIKFTFLGDEHQVNFLDMAVFRTPQNTLAIKAFQESNW